MANITAFISWLKSQHEQIKEIEKSAMALLDAGDDAGYRSKMQQKAELLANLETAAKPFINKLPANVRGFAEDKIHDFSNGGKTAIHLKSVFYMSALLYPDDYKTGEPDNMEKFIQDLKKFQS